jgi:hypothetical protein
MQTRARLEDGREIDYALGLTVTDYKGVPEVSHGGATAGYRTFLARFPQQQLSIALMCNVTNVNTAKLAHQMTDVFLEGQLKEDKPSAFNVAVKELEGKSGLYRNADTDEVQRFFVKDGKLMIGFSTGSELMPLARNRFQVIDSVVEFIFDEAQNGEPLRVRRINGRYPPVIYQAVAQFSPSPAQLVDYAGNYYSEELDVTHSVSVKDGKLKIRISPLPEREMNSIYADAFITSNLGQIKFTRDPAGKVNGYEVFTGRIRHLRFIKR